jgi:hypothetical protein
MVQIVRAIAMRQQLAPTMALVMLTTVAVFVTLITITPTAPGFVTACSIAPTMDHVLLMGNGVVAI